MRKIIIMIILLIALTACESNVNKYIYDDSAVESIVPMPTKFVSIHYKIDESRNFINIKCYGLQTDNLYESNISGFYLYNNIVETAQEFLTPSTIEVRKYYMPDISSHLTLAEIERAISELNISDEDNELNCHWVLVVDYEYNLNDGLIEFSDQGYCFLDDFFEFDMDTGYSQITNRLQYSSFRDIIYNCLMNDPFESITVLK